MRDWSLSPGDPLHLTLAADARLCKPDYVNDHIWEVEFGKADSEQAAVSLYTTFGCARVPCGYFSLYREDSRTVTEPNTLLKKPSLRQILPKFPNP